VAVGVGLGGERFTRGTALAFVLILAGSYLATRRATPVNEPEPEPQPEPEVQAPAK
jgi:drug/metabolite transporter (DMT)-like permease